MAEQIAHPLPALLPLPSSPWRTPASRVGILLGLTCLFASAVDASMLGVGLRDWDTLWVQSYRQDGELRVLIWNRSEERLDIQFREVRYCDDGVRVHGESDETLGDPIAIEAGSIVSILRPRVSEGSFVGVNRNGEDIGVMFSTDESLEIEVAPGVIVLDGYMNGSFRASRTGPAMLTLPKWPVSGGIIDFEAVVDPMADRLMLHCLGRGAWPCVEPVTFECDTGLVSVAPDSSSVVLDRARLPEGVRHRARGVIAIPGDMAEPVMVMGVWVVSELGGHGFTWMIPFASSVSFATVEYVPRVVPPASH